MAHKITHLLHLTDHKETSKNYILKNIIYYTTNYDILMVSQSFFASLCRAIVNVLIKYMHLC